MKITRCLKENRREKMEISHAAEPLVLINNEMEKSSGIGMKDQSCDDAEGVES